jgi:hypothetical protein
MILYRILFIERINMTNKWCDRYEELKDFVAKNPKVEIEQKCVTIPKEYKPEFFRRFYLTISTFVEEEFPELLERAKPLCQSYLREEEEIKKNPALSEVKLPPNVQWFVNDPVDGLRRELYDLLYDLLKAKISIEQFASLGRRIIPSRNNELAALSYQYWLIISLANLLKPERFYTVDLSVGKSSVASLQIYDNAVAPLREPEETNFIAFHHHPYDSNIFVIPDILMRSTRINRWVGIKAEPSLATWTANNASENAEWIEIGQELLMPELVLVSTGDKLEDVALVRDYKKIARPELALICREADDWYETRKDWQILQFTQDILKPKLGLHVASRPEVPEEVTKKLEYDKVLNSLKTQEGEEESIKGIQVANFGLDVSRLEQYVDMLASNG